MEIGNWKSEAKWNQSGSKLEVKKQFWNQRCLIAFAGGEPRRIILNMYVTPMLLLHSDTVLKESCKVELIIFHALDGATECVETHNLRLQLLVN